MAGIEAGSLCLQQAIFSPGLWGHIEQFQTDHPILSTLAETAIVEIASRVAEHFIPVPEGVEVGNAGAARLAITVGPVIEEGIFRAFIAWSLLFSD